MAAIVQCDLPVTLVNLVIARHFASRIIIVTSAGLIPVNNVLILALPLRWLKFVAEAALVVGASAGTSPLAAFLVIQSQLR